MKKKPIIILTGPTASGKSQLSIELARRVGGEIISADSMQVYRHMDIGSAKISKEEMQGVPHHMLDILEPSEDFNVTLFQKKCKEYLSEIYERGNIPILVGGTGFYIQAVLYDIDFTENTGTYDFRRELELLAEEKGVEYLHMLLRLLDPNSAESIHPNNKKRTIRALEFYWETGMPISKHNETERKKEAFFDSAYFVLNDVRTRLYERIDERVDRMVEEGLVSEVQKLKDMGCGSNMVSMQGLGYKEILKYLEGEISLEEAMYLIKRDTRHFAKRQLTWFRREKDVIWIEKEKFAYDKEAILDFMLKELKQKGIL